MCQNKYGSSRIHPTDEFEPVSTGFTTACLVASALLAEGFVINRRSLHVQRRAHANEFIKDVKEWSNRSASM